LIESDEVLSSLEQSSKYDTRQAFLQELKAFGRLKAEHWIDSNWRDMGQRSTCDLKSLFL
jgi:hypothetical protein